MTRNDLYVLLVASENATRRAEVLRREIAVAEIWGDEGDSLREQWLAAYRVSAEASAALHEAINRLPDGDLYEQR